MSIHLFLAHASEDKAAVLELYERLEAQGYRPWVDQKNLIPGQNWREEIPKAIRHSQLFIACVSPRFVSKQEYVQKELRLALDAYAEKPPGSIYLIPLKLEPCDVPDIRLEQLGVRLRDLHWVDYWEPDGFDTLVNAIEYQVGQFEASELDAAILPTPESLAPHPPSSSLSESVRPIQIYREALAMRKRLLGAEHPTVATSLNNLAGLYANQGRYRDAEPLYLEAVGIAYQQLGERHPTTQTVLNNFADCLHQAMESGKADTLSDHPITQGLLKHLQPQNEEEQA